MTTALKGVRPSVNCRCWTPTDMPPADASTTSNALAARLRALLEATETHQLPLTYQQAAEALGLMPPRTIRRVAEALEVTIHEDVAAGRPLLATLVVSPPAPSPAWTRLLQPGRCPGALSRASGRSPAGLPPGASRRPGQSALTLVSDRRIPAYPVPALHP